MTAGAGTNRFGYRPELDGIRGIAVPLAFWWHAWILGLTEPLGGHGGVDAFFVLSGYLITSLLLEEHDRTGGISFRNFYVRRGLRLLPALFVMLLLAWWAASSFEEPSQSFLKQALFTLAYSANWIFDGLGVLSHTWTLALEEQYYLLWPGVLLISLRAGVSRRTLALTSLAIAVVIAFLRFATYGRFSGVLFNVYNTYGRIDGLFIGNALALLPAMWVWARHRWVAIVALVVLVGTMAYQLRLEPQFDAPEPYQRVLFLVISICVTVIIAHTHWKRDGAGVRFLSLRPWRWMGRISYGLYLYHVPVFVLVAQLRLPVVWSLMAGIGATYVLAILSYRFVEEPLLRLKSRIAPRTPGQVVTTPT